MTREELLQTAKPILFNTDMVRAILDGRKTVTRRVVKQIACDASWGCGCVCWDHGKVGRLCDSGCVWLDIQRPPYQPGDILYVRETWRKVPGVPPYVYKSTCNDGITRKWKPSIHMPKGAARIFLRVTDVRAEQLQDMPLDAPLREGILCDGTFNPTKKFVELWNSTIKKKDLDKYGWDANPWSWVIEFERIMPE